MHARPEIETPHPQCQPQLTYLSSRPTSSGFSRSSSPLRCNAGEYLGILRARAPAATAWATCARHCGSSARHQFNKAPGYSPQCTHGTSHKPGSWSPAGGRRCHAPLSPPLRSMSGATMAPTHCGGPRVPASAAGVMSAKYRRCPISGTRAMHRPTFTPRLRVTAETGGDSGDTTQKAP